jgi:hypothetical protein
MNMEDQDAPLGYQHYSEGRDLFQTGRIAEWLKEKLPHREMNQLV